MPEKDGTGAEKWRLDATPEEVARALFAAVEPPDPQRQRREPDGPTVKATV